MKLNWTDVDPDKHGYNPETAVEIAANAINSTPKGKVYWKKAVEDEIDRGFTESYGLWASGWRFSRGEGSGPEHSIKFNKKTVDVSATAKLAANGLNQWYEHLHIVKKFFQTIPLTLNDNTATALDLYSACPRIIAFVMEKTMYEDAWYDYAERVLSWYLEFLGVEIKTANQIANHALAGRFESWIKPSDDLIENVANDYMSSVLPYLTNQSDRS
jgi:hypothetical protein